MEGAVIPFHLKPLFICHPFPLEFHSCLMTPTTGVLLRTTLTRTIVLYLIITFEPPDDVFTFITQKSTFLQVEKLIRNRTLTTAEIAINNLQSKAPYRGHPTNFHIWQLRVNTSTQQPMQRCSTFNRANFARRGDVNQICTPWLAYNF